MDAGKQKTTSVAKSTKANQPFFSKDGEGSFFGEKINQEASFFKPSSAYRVNGNAVLQTKLTIGQPNDPDGYRDEKEADAMADKVVQRLASPEPLTKKEVSIQAKPLAQTIAPLVQAKCADCESASAKASAGKDEKLQKKEDEKEEEMEGLQLKSSVAIGEPNDAYEKEADIVAESITGISAVNAMSMLQRKDTEGEDSPELNSAITSAELTQGGSSLQGSVQNFYESRMGRDFSEVKVHQGSDAEHKNNFLQSHAFTYGSHIWLGENQTPSANFIMAHEMAHVVQQTQPELHHKMKSGTTEKNRITELFPKVQRFIYWDQLKGFAGIPAGGGGAHKELQGSMAAGSIITEAPIPNASRTAGGDLGTKTKPLFGRADFYEATSKIGINFVLPNTTESCGITQLATPISLRGATNDGNPRLDKKKNEIIHIADGPTNITLGEIKPAETKTIEDGKKQMDFYEKGITFAKDQTNCWSNKHPDISGSTPQWSLNSINRFDDSTMPIPDEYKYSSSTMKADRNLGIVDFKGEEIEGKSSHVKLNPKKDLGREVKGGFYAIHAGKGIIAYFYRPADLPGLLSGLGIDPKSAEFKAYIEFATFLQNQVITPLLTGPEKITAKQKKDSDEQITKSQKEIRHKERSIQRAPQKPPKLKDPFNLAQWRGNHNKHQKNFKNQKEDTKSKLHFLELVYQTEGALKQAGVPEPAKKLPPKSNFEVELGKKIPTDKPTEKNLTTLYSWMNLWAKEPIDYLGRFRSRFGSAFVKIADKFGKLKKKLSDKFKKAKKTHSPSGKSYGVIAVRAFWEALIRAGGYVFENTVHLLVLSLESGLKDKLKTIIPIEGEEFQKMVDEGFPQLKEIQQTIEALENDFQKKVDEVVGQFDAEIATIKEIADEAKIYGNIIKAAMIAIQCGTPPGWGCLKLIASRLIAEAIDSIMKWCWTQEQFDDIVKATGVLDMIPKKLAGYTADGIESALPKFSPLFDRSLFDTNLSLPDKIPCDEGPTELHKAYAALDEELKNKLGEEGYDLFLLAMEKYGVKSDTEFSAAEIREMMEKIPKDITEEDLRRFLASNPKKDDGELFDVGEFLEKVRESRLPDNFQWFYVVHTPAAGHTKGEKVDAIVTVSPYQSATEWTPVKRLIIPAKVIRRLSVDSEVVKLQVFYLPNSDTVFQMFSNEFTISASKEMWGYRPDPFRQD